MCPSQHRGTKPVGEEIAMHTLHLLRHAKSSRKVDVEDHLRPLNKRGREAAQLVGRHLPRTIGSVDLVLCSSAARTRETAELVLARFQPRPPSLIEVCLYLADCDKLIERLRLLEDGVTSVLLIGHNPGLRDLSVALAEPRSPLFASLANDKFPTLARASFHIGTRWSQIGEMRHRLVAYVTPASLSRDAH
jgi:phosphohistidine phosphatase